MWKERLSDHGEIYVSGKGWEIKAGRRFRRGQYESAGLARWKELRPDEGNAERET